LIAYLDTSAWVKIYIPEIGREELIQILKSVNNNFSHQITYVDFFAAIGKAMRIQMIDQKSAEEIVENFKNDWGDCNVMEVSQNMLEIGAAFALRYQLRGYDSLQLAAAHILSEAYEETITFVCFDKQLNQAAKKLGMRTL